MVANLCVLRDTPYFIGQVLQYFVGGALQQHWNQWISKTDRGKKTKCLLWLELLALLILNTCDWPRPPVLLLIPPKNTKLKYKFLVSWKGSNHAAPLSFQGCKTLLVHFNPIKVSVCCMNLIKSLAGIMEFDIKWQGLCFKLICWDLKGDVWAVASQCAVI